MYLKKIELLKIVGGYELNWVGIISTMNALLSEYVFEVQEIASKD